MGLERIAVFSRKAPGEVRVNQVVRRCEELFPESVIGEETLFDLLRFLRRQSP
jgi:hypothetical protein